MVTDPPKKPAESKQHPRNADLLYLSMKDEAPEKTFPDEELDVDVEPDEPLDGIEAIDLSPLGREYKPGRRENLKLRLISLVTGLALIMILTAILQRQDFSFSYFLEKPDTNLEEYLRVGPVATTLANDDIIEFSIDIDCGDKDKKGLLAEKDSEIRDIIMAILTTPGNEKLIQNREYDAIKSKIREELGDIAFPVEDIYIAEVLLY